MVESIVLALLRWFEHRYTEYPTISLCDGVEISYWNVGDGSLGLHGELGYAGKHVVVPHLGTRVQWVSAHVPSRVVLKLRKKYRYLPRSTIPPRRIRRCVVS